MQAATMHPLWCRTKDLSDRIRDSSLDLVFDQSASKWIYSSTVVHVRASKVRLAVRVAPTMHVQSSKFREGRQTCSPTHPSLAFKPRFARLFRHHSSGEAVVSNACKDRKSGVTSDDHGFAISDKFKIFSWMNFGEKARAGKDYVGF